MVVAVSTVDELGTSDDVTVVVDVVVMVTVLMDASDELTIGTVSGNISSLGSTLTGCKCEQRELSTLTGYKCEQRQLSTLTGYKCEQRELSTLTGYKCEQQQQLSTLTVSIGSTSY